MQLKNLTPHSVEVLAGDALLGYDTVLTIPPSGVVARVSTETVSNGVIETRDGYIPLFCTVFGGVEDLPPPEFGVLLIVSRMVAERAWAEGRADVIVPTAFVRSVAGSILGCQGFDSFEKIHQTQLG